jgi:hypothetical protein
VTAVCDCVRISEGNKDDDYDDYDENADFDMPWEKGEKIGPRVDLVILALRGREDNGIQSIKRLHVRLAPELSSQALLGLTLPC